MGRSLRVHEKYKDKVKKALAINGIGSQKSLAKGFKDPMSLSTVSNFFNCKPVDRENFVRICDALNLDISEICALGEDFVEDETPNSIFSATLSAIRFLKQSNLSYLLFGEPTNIDNYLSFNSSHSGYNDRYLQMEAAIHFKDKLKECDFEIGKNYFESSYLLFKKYDILIQDWETSKKSMLDVEVGIDTLQLKATIPIFNHGKEAVFSSK